jgi:hypothetical protein
MCVRSSAFCHYNKVPEVINLQEERFILAHGLRGPVHGRAVHCFRPLPSMPYGNGGEPVVEQTAFLMARKQEERKGQDSHSPL